VIAKGSEYVELNISREVKKNKRPSKPIQNEGIENKGGWENATKKRKTSQEEDRKTRDEVNSDDYLPKSNVPVGLPARRRRDYIPPAVPETSTTIKNTKKSKSALKREATSQQENQSNGSKFHRRLTLSRLRRLCCPAHKKYERGLQEYSRKTRHF
jgi:hypothetical protein